MAILALATSLPDMRERLGNMVIGNSKAGASLTQMNSKIVGYRLSCA